MLHGITRFNYLVKYKIWKAFSFWEWKLLSVFYFSKHGIPVMILGYRDVVSAVQNHWASNKWLFSVEQPKLWRLRDLHVSLLSVCLTTFGDDATALDKPWASYDTHRHQHNLQSVFPASVLRIWQQRVLHPPPPVKQCGAKRLADCLNIQPAFYHIRKFDMANTEHTVNSTGKRPLQHYVIYFETRKTPLGQLRDHSSTL